MNNETTDERALEQLRKELDSNKQQVNKLNDKMAEMTILMERIIHNVEGVRNNQSGWAQQMEKNWNKFDKLYEAVLTGNHESRVHDLESSLVKTEDRLFKIEMFINKLNTFWLVVPGVATIIGVIMALIGLFEKIAK